MRPMAPTGPSPATPKWATRLWRWGQRLLGQAPSIPAPLWQRVLQRHPFALSRTPEELQHLRRLCEGFLASKEFHGTRGLRITDEMALTVALQACLPLLHWGADALDWYDDFVGIVIHPGEVLARREVTDEAGVVHHYSEALAGEAMAGGPIMLTWSHVEDAAQGAARGHNLVIHEFAHKLDMRGKALGDAPDGCPPLPAGFMGCESPLQAHHLWRDTLEATYERFRQAVDMAERFGAPWPWLDPYGAHSPAEFFAVACEAYFVNRARFTAEFPALAPLFEAFFQPGKTPVSGAAAP
jgi:MtfA peptidase